VDHGRKNVEGGLVDGWVTKEIEMTITVPGDNVPCLQKRGGRPVSGAHEEKRNLQAQCAKARTKRLVEKTTRAAEIKKR